MNLDTLLEEDWLYEQHFKEKRSRSFFTYTVLKIGNHVDENTPGYYKKYEVVDEFGWVAFRKRYIPDPLYLYDVKYLNIPKEERVVLELYLVCAWTAESAFWKVNDASYYLRNMSKNELDEWFMKDNYPYRGYLSVFKGRSNQK